MQSLVQEDADICGRYGSGAAKPTTGTVLSFGAGWPLYQILKGIGFLPNQGLAHEVLFWLTGPASSTRRDILQCFKGFENISGMAS